MRIPKTIHLWTSWNRVACLGVFTLTLLAGKAEADYLKMNPPPDVDKGWLYKIDPVTEKKIWNNSCWFASAANMLAGAGYGNGLTAQNRALDIYANMVNHYVTTLQDWTTLATRGRLRNGGCSQVTTCGQLTRTIRLLACSNSRDQISRNP